MIDKVLPIGIGTCILGAIICILTDMVITYLRGRRKYFKVLRNDGKVVGVCTSETMSDIQSVLNEYKYVRISKDEHTHYCRLIHTKVLEGADGVMINNVVSDDDLERLKSLITAGLEKQKELQDVNK